MVDLHTGTIETVRAGGTLLAMEAVEALPIEGLEANTKTIITIIIALIHLARTVTALIKEAKGLKTKGEEDANS